MIQKVGKGFKGILLFFVLVASAQPALSAKISMKCWMTALSLATLGFTAHQILTPVHVQGRSMAPTLVDGDSYFESRPPAWFHKIKRGDIVVFHDPEVGGHSVKRVIGLPGEKVELRKGKVFVNGVLLPEPYLDKKIKTWPMENERTEFQLGSTQYFLLGDNRDLSADSRTYGPVDQKLLRGKIVNLFK